MQDFLIFAALFAPLAFFNLSDVVRRGEFRYLWVQIPFYAVTLAVNVMVAGGARYESITKLIEHLLSNIVK